MFFIPISIIMPNVEPSKLARLGQFHLVTNCVNIILSNNFSYIKYYCLYIYFLAFKVLTYVNATILFLYVIVYFYFYTSLQ